MENPKHNHRSTNETGDIKNLENLQKHITHCKSLQPGYHPVNDDITTASLNKHRIKAWEVYEDLRTKRTDFILVTNRRQDRFNPVRKLATRLNGAVSGAGYDEKTYEDFTTITRKIQGRLSKPKTKENESNQELQRAVSNSQQSYDQLLDNFADAIRFLERLGNFNPNETDLQIETLKRIEEELRAVNREYFETFKPFGMALDMRDLIFYDAQQGFIQKIMTSRDYLKSVYGYESPEYKFAISLHFRTFRRKKQ